MSNHLRMIATASLAAMIMLLVLAGSAHSQSWNSTANTGLTSLIWDLVDDRYTWTLVNNSTLAVDLEPDFDILVWELTPYQIQEPLAWTAPEGWTWSGKKMELLSNSENYKTPHALAPGQSMTFTYQINPTGRYINTSAPADTGPLFAAHVAAVVPFSGSLDGSDRWEQYVADSLGRTWHDRVELTRADTHVIPEPAGLFVLGFASCGIATLGIRGRKSRPR